MTTQDDETTIVPKVCTRCGIGTERYWNWWSKREDVTLCSDCMMCAVAFLISTGVVKPSHLIEYATETKP